MRQAADIEHLFELCSFLHRLNNILYSPDIVRLSTGIAYARDFTLRGPHMNKLPAKIFHRKRIYTIVTGSAVIIAMAGLMVYSQEALEAAKNGIILCYNVIIPTLFPFFVLSALLVELGLAGYFGRLFEGIMRPLFNVSGACATAFALGFVGGYPTGAKTAIAVYEKGMCSKTEAERLLAFCNNSGPAFILGVVGAGIFSSGRAGIFLYLAHAAASVAVGLIFRFYKRREHASHSGADIHFDTVSLPKVFASSVTNSFTSTLSICAFVIFFTVAIRMLFLFGIIPALAEGLGALLSPLELGPTDAEQLLTGLIEVSSGVWSLRGAAGSMREQLAMAAFMLGWAGLSVHCQVLSFIGASGLSTKTYIAGKMLHGIFSAIFVYIAAGFFSFDAPVFSYLVEQLDAITSLSFTSSLTLSLSAVGGVLAAVLIAIIFSSVKKVWKKRL